MKEYILVVFCFILYNCDFAQEDTIDKDELKALRMETDSLKEEINKLKRHAGDTGLSINSTRYVNPEMKDSGEVFKKESNVKVPEKIKQISKVPATSSFDTLFYFYTNPKKISARIDPRNKDQKKRIRFYDTSGNITFEQEDVYKSYSISTELKEFHMNGAVKRIVIHYNPGASMHWYETIITFDTDNVPVWKEEITYPLTLEGMMDNKYYWNKNTKQWGRQEVVIEQPLQK